MKTKNFFAGHSSGGRTERFKKMKTFFKNLMPMLLLVAGLGISPNVKADDWSVDVYCVPEWLFGDGWRDDDNQWIRANVQRINDGNSWYAWSMSATGDKYNGYDIYKGTIWLYGGQSGAQTLQFQRMEGGKSDQVNGTVTGFSGYWTSPGFSGKICIGENNWIDKTKDASFNKAILYYTIDNGAESDYGFDGNSSYPDFLNGKVINTNLKITNFELQYSKNGGNICNGHLGYRLGSGQDQRADAKWDNGKLVMNGDDIVIARNTDPSGIYSLSMWWKVNGQYIGTDNCNAHEWCFNNGGSNFTWTFTILPPDVSNFAVSASGYKSGLGTSSDPYLVQCGSTLTLSASGPKEHDDANSSFQVKFGNNDYSATTTRNITVNSTTKTTIVVKGKYRNSTASLDGEESSKTIYYQAVYTGLTAVASPAAAVSNNPTISATSTSSSVTVGAGTANTGYQFKNWSSSNGNFGSTTTASTTFTPNANSAVATANYQIKVTFDNQSHDTAPADQWIDYNGKVTKPSDLSEAGWEFGGWYKENTCTNQWDFSSDVVTAPITLYAKWTQSSVYYKITKGVNDEVMGSITSNAADESKVLSGSNITFTAHPNTGYEVEAWYTDAACTQDEHDPGQTTYSQVINSDATVYVKFKETKYSVTISKGTGIQSVIPSGERQVGNVNPVEISATVATGYTWNQWTLTGNVTTTGNVTDNPISVKATGTGTVTATATENMTTVSVASNNTDWGTVDKSEVSVGVTTTATLTATKNSGYKFVSWALTDGATLSSGALTDATITIKGNGIANSTGTATATFEEDLSSGIYVEGGNPPFGGWSTDAANEMLKTTGHSTSNDIYYHFTTTKVDQEADFKLFDKNHNPGWLASSGYYWYSYCTEQAFDYGNGLTNMRFIGTVIGDYVFHYNTQTKKFDITYPDVYCLMGVFNSWSSTSHPFNTTSNQVSIDLAENTEYAFRVVYQGKYYRVDGKMTSESCTDWNIYNDGSHGIDIRIQSAAAGTYTFTFNPTAKQLSVSYPGETTHTVTVDNGETQKDVEVKEVTETPLVASQYLNGMRFDRWVVTNSEGVVQENKITINHPENYSTHMHGATEDGLIVKATYTSHGIIYFKNNPGWSEVKVYFYSGEYFDQTYGTGCVAKGDDWSDRKANGYGMTHLANTDIWYYDWQSAGLTPDKTIVAFTVNLQTEAQWFDENQVVYRGDWHDEAPLFVPYNYIHRYLNKHDGKQTCYYDEGLWMKYNSTESGYDIRGEWGEWAKADNQYFTATSPGGYEFTSGPITLPGSTDNERFIVYLAPKGILESYFAEYGTMIGKGNKITPSQPYTRVYDKKTSSMGDGYIQTTAGADYIFKLSLGDGQIIVSVEYPLSEGDYQVVSVTEGKVHSNGLIYKQGAEASLASFFIEQGKTTALKLQKCSTFVDNKPVWEDIDVTYAIPQTMETGIYNFRINPLATNPTIENLNQVYSGKYYIRTDGIDGGWESYQTNADNEMYDYGSMLDAGVTYGSFPYDYYKTKWIPKDKNVKFTIANDYSKCISDSLVGDAIIGNEVMNLPEKANVRFMWNSATNQLKRAYISGSTDISDRFLVLEGDAKMFDKDGNALTEAGGGKIDGLNDNEMNFADNNNWVYQADIKAQPGCAVKLTAKYNSQVQYFIGAAGDGEGSRKTIIDGTKTSDKQYAMRAVYDFKTNRLVAGWVPDGTEISSEIKLGGDMLLVREHQGDASQITFGATGSVSDIHHIYSVLTIKKDTMLGKANTEYTTAATNTDYKRTMYWISFPFDVKISEVFGVDGYGKKWIMQRYNGAKRAEIGWFAETETFWEYLAPTSTLQAYKGYLLILNANYFNTDGADVWKNSATEANFYFPSAEKNIGIINKSSVEIEVPAHECGIDRPFADDASKNHTITDSYWNVIGVPAFQDAPAVATLAKDCNLKSYYKWNSTNNTYDVETVDVDEVTFKTMHAYMVQFGGKLTWENVSVVNNPTTAPYHYADAKNYRIELFFNGNGAEDHTYINLADGAHTDFVLNEDMMKIDNSGQPNIYSFAGAYDVAYNETTFDNQTVMLGVSAPKNGSYTFAMPKDFSGKAVLVDLESGEATDLNLSNYTVELNKGTYNNRFQLLLEVEAKAPTAIDNAKGEWSVDGKTKKLFINDNIYLINAGRIYNASGTKVR